MPVGLLRADNNLPPWRPGLKEVILGEKKKQFLFVFLFVNLYSNTKGEHLSFCMSRHTS